VTVIQIFSEVRELKQWKIFAHEQNLELLTNKLREVRCPCRSRRGPRAPKRPALWRPMRSSAKGA